MTHSKRTSPLLIANRDELFAGVRRGSGDDAAEDLADTLDSLQRGAVALERLDPRTPGGLEQLQSINNRYQTAIETMTNVQQQLSSSMQSIINRLK